MSDQGIEGSPAFAARPRLLDGVREVVRRRHYSYRTEETYLHWIMVYTHVLNKGGRGVKSPLELTG